MKNIFVFYTLIFAPLVILYFWGFTGKVDAITFSVYLFVYALFYHPFISGMRLLQIGKIKPNEFAKNFIPFWNKKYFKSLYFG